MVFYYFYVSIFCKMFEQKLDLEINFCLWRINFELSFGQQKVGYNFPAEIIDC